MQTAVDKRTEKLRNILDGANAAIAEKNGSPAADLNELPQVIAGIPTNIGLQLPEVYSGEYSAAEALCRESFSDFMSKEWRHTFAAESDTYIIIGFAPESGISVTEYNAATTEYRSTGWVGCVCSKETGETAVQDYRQQASPEGNYIEDIKYSGCYIFYGDSCLFPVGAAAHPVVAAIDYSAWDSGAFTETLETGDVLSYEVTFDGNGRPVSIALPDGGTVTVDWGEE